MASGKTYFWNPTHSDTTYRELIMEMLRPNVSPETFPILPRIHHIDVEAMTKHHRQHYGILQLDPNNATSKDEMEKVIIYIDHVWSFLNTWCDMAWPGSLFMRDKHNLCTSIWYDMSGPDAMFTFVYEGKDFVNAYLDEECLRKKIDMKKFRQTVHFANRGKKN